MNPLQQQFLDWLAQTPAKLAELARVLKAFYDVSGIPQAKIPTEAPGVVEYRVGGEQEMTTVALSDAELIALQHEFAEGIVKEKALEFVKGFILGVTVAA